MIAPIKARLTNTGRLYTVGTFDDTTGIGHSITATHIFADELDENTLSTGTPSGGSILLNGTSQRIDVTTNDFQFGTHDFTIEGWFFLTSTAYTRLWCFPDGDNVEVNNGTMYYWNGGGSVISAGTGTAPQGRWFHVALVKYQNVAKVYLNGIAVITDSSPFNSTSSRPLSIGGEVSGLSEPNSTTLGWLAGHVTNFRIVKGIAVYLSNFSTAFNPLTVIPNTVLLLNVVNSGQLVHDSSPSSQTVTNIGGAQYDAATPLNTYFNGAMKQLKNGALLLADELDETHTTLS
jgi:Concanavalin A-like lectin/glucanases superfamily